ncbi:MAG TPA: hypothetical protein VIG69_07885 [Candidatus Methylomirabilis sp.]|jgi:hypothetical protein
MAGLFAPSWTSRQTLEEVRRLIAIGLARGQDAAGPVRKRLNAPLVGPPRFGTAREYRTWREQRRTQPKTPGALHWPLGVWLAIGVAVTLWLGSLLS